MSVETILSVIGWPALVFYLLAAVTFRDPSQAVRAGFKGALLGIAVLVLNVLFLFTFGGLPSETYRYKLTLSVDTPDGVKTGSNVVELHYFSVHFPAQGEMHDSRGQALYLDLGQGRRPLIALLTHIRRNDEVAENGHLYRYRWSEDSPSIVLADACLGGADDLDWMEMVKRFKEHCRKPIPIVPGDLPDLVTFTDVKDPKNVVVVDPFHLAATLGAGVSWRSMTLEVTDEPLTKSIDERMPWVRGYDPNIWIPDLRSFNGLHDFVNTRDFIRGCCGLLAVQKS
jgi:hypothetical protein